ncbi:MAG: hypothetical protein QM478_01165 [Flavobacteriaceae bacterium]
MNKTLITILSVFGITGALLGLLFSFLPISNLAIFPATFGLILGLISYLSAKKQQFNFSFARTVVLLSLLAIIISMGKQLLMEDEVKTDTEFIQKEKQSKEDAVKELEELDDELDELE